MLKGEQSDAGRLFPTPTLCKQKKIKRQGDHLTRRVFHFTPLTNQPNQPFPRTSPRPLHLDKSFSTFIPMDKSLDEVRFVLWLRQNILI